MGVPICIVRNLGILKIIFDLPTRSDQYKIEPVEVSLTKIATSIIGKEKIKSSKQAITGSKTRFIKFFNTIKDLFLLFSFDRSSCYQLIKNQLKLGN